MGSVGGSPLELAIGAGAMAIDGEREQTVLGITGGGQATCLGWWSFP